MVDDGVPGTDVPIGGDVEHDDDVVVGAERRTGDATPGDGPDGHTHRARVGHHHDDLDHSQVAGNADDLHESVESDHGSGDDRARHGIGNDRAADDRAVDDRSPHHHDHDHDHHDHDTTTTTTIACQPTAMQDLTLYLKSPGAGGGPSPAAAAAAHRTAPSSGSVFRTTLEDGGGVPDGEQRFRWDTASWVRFTGTAGATLYVSGPSLLGLGGELVVDVELRHCAATTARSLATRRVTSPGPLLGLGYATVSVNFGAIDVVLTSGESLELVVIAPSATTRDVWLAHDTTGTRAGSSFDRS